jgi:RNA polymerase sigma-70 factor (ECF subfamily)
MIKDQHILVDIVDKCVKGNRKAQRKLYETFYGKMMGVCYRYTSNKEDAKDVLQDGFIKVFCSINKYKFNGSLEGWIRRIMVNTAIDHYRKNKTIFFIEDEDGILLDKAKIESENGIYSKFGEEVIMKSIELLSPAYKTVFNLNVIEGFQHKEIAQKLGISEGTSKSNLAKAKIKLRLILSELETKVDNE